MATEGAEEVKLHGMWASPFGHRIEIALKLKGIPFQFIEEDIFNKSPDLLNYNPVHKKVPILIHNGKPISESLVILEYIDEHWKQNPILPQDPYDRAMARFWADFVYKKLMRTSYQTIVRTGKEKEEAVEEVHEQLQFLEEELKGKSYFGGESIGYVDIVTIPVIFWMERAQQVAGVVLIETQKLPKICEWIDKLSEIEAVKESKPPLEKHLEYMRTYYISPR